MVDKHDKNIKKQVNQKNKILSYIKKGETETGIKLLRKFFSDKNPPDTVFMSAVYEELNKTEQTELAFHVIEEFSKALFEDEDYQKLRENARRVYFNSLLSEGNKLLAERDERASKFEEALKRVDSLAKDKVSENNAKILTNMTNKALAVLSKAFELEPKNVSVLSGMYRCHKLLNDEEKSSMISSILEEVSPLISGKNKNKETISSEGILTAKDFNIEDFNIKEVEKLLENKKYQKVIDKVDTLHLSHKLSVPLLTLKTEALIALKRFHEADKTVDEADKTNTCLKEVQMLREQVKEIKFDLLSKAGETYLKKGLEFGKSLGKNHFVKAKKCLIKAIEIYPHNLELYDHLYTVHKYLDETEEAFRAKANIYRLNKNHIPSFDREGANSLCFLASYAYFETPTKLEDFRWFRREILLCSNFGRYLNRVYVRMSPGVVKFSKSNGIKPSVFRLLLFPARLFLKLLRWFQNLYREYLSRCLK